MRAAEHISQHNEWQRCATSCSSTEPSRSSSGGRAARSVLRSRCGTTSESLARAGGYSLNTLTQHIRSHIDVAVFRNSRRNGA